MMRICPECNNILEDSANFCDYCGLQLSPPKGEDSSPESPEEEQQEITPDSKSDKGGMASVTCAACGYENLAGEMFCQNCGVQLAPVASKPPPPPVPVDEKSIPAEEPADTSPIVCPACSHRNMAGEVFCQNCGLQLPQHEAKVTSTGEPGSEPPLELETSPAIAHLPPDSANLIHGTLVVKVSGQIITLPSDQTEITLGRSDPVREIYPDIDLTSYGGDSGGVSRMHARLVGEKGQVYIEDLNSTNYTFLNRQKLQPGQRYLMDQGDEIRLGLLILEYQKD